MIKTFIPLLAGFILIILIGCNPSSNPAQPSINEPVRGSDSSNLTPLPNPEVNFSAISPVSQSLNLNAETSYDNHKILGAWRVRLFEDGSIEVLPRRTEQAHWNVKDIILGCPTCFTIDVLPPPGPNMFDFEATLSNPTNITGFDVTGIIRSSGDIQFLNPDSYTFIYSFPGDTTPNPYKAWDTGIGNREFAGLVSHSEVVQFKKGGLTKFGEIDFLFQASYPANQQEPYEIWSPEASGTLDTNGLDTVDLNCNVGDWQGNVDSVVIDLTPIGGSSSSAMTFVSGNQWSMTGVSYSFTGQGAGIHNLKITATSAGVSTYNYLPMTVVSSQPVKQGSFIVTHQNLPLMEPNGPTDGMDLAVMGADDGTFVTMVFGGDDTYHFWRNDYQSGTFGLYYNDTGLPIMPFDIPNYRFDFADTSIPDSSVDSIFTLGWGEANKSTEILQPDSIPQVKASQRITLWNMTGASLKLTANILVIGSNPGPPQTYGVIVKPIEFASGQRKDGLLYMVLAYDAGDASQFPVVDIMALKPPLDFQDNPDLVSGGYEIGIPDGTGPGMISRSAIVGVDVDDTQILPITGGYAGHAWVMVAEAGGLNTLDIINADIEGQTQVFKTVTLPAAPLDVAILPVPGLFLVGVLCADNLVHIYDYEGNYAGFFGGPPYMTGTALRLDVDDTNLTFHVLHQNPLYTMVSAYQWDG